MYKWIFALLISTAFSNELSDQEESTFDEVLDYQEIQIETAFNSNSQVWMPLAPPKPSRFKTEIKTFVIDSPTDGKSGSKIDRKHGRNKTTGFSITWERN